MRLCWHSWFKWSALIQSYNGHKTQFRTCSKCGKTKFRDLGYCDGVPTQQANEAIESTGADNVWRISN